MSRKEWQKVKEIVEDALELERDDRSSFLDEVCAGDDDLRRSVESLLVSFDGGSFTQLEPENGSSTVPVDGEPIVRPGERVGRYQIIDELATGGMGEVYIARDIRLDRKAAIKFLRKEFSRSFDPQHRFEREAKSASALNHPNIITIYEIGKWKNADFIAMEYVEGDSVRRFMAERRIELDEALNITAQVASALAAAHSAGIIHRDIKPENIMRRPDGLVKVLDFGLAKQTFDLIDKEEVDSEAVTRGAHSTIPGMIMGTVAYMSPEQARGRKTDARTDIWSLGVVLYELVTGRVPFSGETKSDLLVAILQSEPAPLNAAGAEISREFEHIIGKALAKDRDERYQHVKDFMLDLKILQSELSSGDEKTEILSFATAEEKPVKTEQAVSLKSERLTPPRGSMWPVIPVLVLIAIFGFWYIWQRSFTTAPGPITSIASTQITSWKSEIGENGSSRPRISPDGKLLTFVAPKNGHDSIWIKQIGGGEAFTRKQDESDDQSPIWSPDGGQIAYFSDRGGRRGIWQAPALGGAPALISNTESRCQLLLWSKDGSTIYYQSKQDLYALDVASANSTKLTKFDDSRIMDREFAISPDGHRIVYTDVVDGRSDLWISDLNGDDPKKLTDDAEDDSTPVWHPDGKRVIYNSERSGIRQIFIAFVDGHPPQQLGLADSDNFVSDISADGTKIVYTTTKDDSDIWSANLETGKETQVSSDIGVEFWPSVSPNGSSVAYQSLTKSSVGTKLINCKITVRSIEGGSAAELADDGFDPLWSTDGKYIAFLRSVAGSNQLWVSSAAGGDARALTAGNVAFGGYSLLPYDRLQSHDYTWSPDGRSIVYSASPSGVPNIWRVALDGSGEIRLTDNQDPKLLFFDPMVSPDGGRIAWLAMSVSNPKARAWSIWVLNNGSAAQVYQSESGMRLIGWSASGNEVIFRTLNSTNDSLRLPTDVTVSQIPAAGGSPSAIMTLNSAYFHNFQLSPDRRSIVYTARLENADAIKSVSLAGREPRTIAAGNDPRVYYSDIAFSPDGKTIFYGKQANWQVISMVNNFK
jgi:serine/threonine protein kinase